MPNALLQGAPAVLAGAMALALIATHSVIAEDATPGVRYDEPALETGIHHPHHHVGVFAGAATRLNAPEEEEEETGLSFSTRF